MLLLFPFVKNLVAFFASLAGGTGETVYDFKLDQWGLYRNPSESLTTYVDNVLASSIWTDNKDISLWTLSPDGAVEINANYGSCDPNVFYLSWTTADTYQPLFFSPDQFPLPDMFAVLWPFATFMGSYTRSASTNPPLVGIDSSWFQNDGVVNSVAQAGPSVGCVIRPYTSTIGLGIFNNMGVQQDWDHLDIVGLSTDPLLYLDNAFVTFYSGIAATLAALPVVSSSSSLTPATSPTLEANLTKGTVPENTVYQESNSINVTALTCGKAESVYDSMCVNATLGSGLTFSSSDCNTLQINLKSCQERLGGAGVVHGPSSWLIVMMIACFVLYWGH